jgi:DNA-binding MarR family transcriptional regulator
MYLSGKIFSLRDGIVVTALRSRQRETALHKPQPLPELLASVETNWPEAAQQLRPVVLYLYRARDQLFQDLVETLAPLGLLPADLDVLGALRVRPPPHELTPTELYRSLLLSSGGLSKILHRLEVAGLIERRANSADGRSRLVCLSPQGALLAESLVERVGAHQRRFLSPLDPTEQAELCRLLTKLVRAGGG